MKRRRLLKLLWLMPVLFPLIKISLPDLWNTYISQKIAISFIIEQVNYLYRNNPTATIAMIASFIGIVSLYYGSLVKSENMYSRFVGEIEIYLNALSFFTPIPTILLFSYPLYKLVTNFSLNNLLIVVLVCFVCCHQWKIYSQELLKRLSKRYDYDNLLRFIKQRTTSWQELMKRKIWILHLIYATLLFVDLLMLDLNFLEVIFVGWLYFVSTTLTALVASLSEASYHVVDIKTKDTEYTKAIYIRDERGIFMRIVPDPSQTKSHNSILINKNNVLAIKYRKIE